MTYFSEYNYFHKHQTRSMNYSYGNEKSCIAKSPYLFIQIKERLLKYNSKFSPNPD